MSRSPDRNARDGGRADVDRADTRFLKRVAIVGAGVSGLGMAVQLKAAGIPFTIFEKAGEVGGTWRDNHYPGLKVDVPLALYRYSFERIGDWRSLLPSGPDLQARMVHLCDSNGIREHIHFDAEIITAQWTGSAWRLETKAGEIHEAEVLVHATGFLHHPKTPDIAGLDRFGGDVMHSARWDDLVPLDDRRIAVIGCGSTGTQLVAALAPKASQLTLFARTPQWILPVPDLKIPRVLNGLLRRSRAVENGLRAQILWSFGALLGGAANKNGWERRLFGWLARKNLETVKDPELRRRLTPSSPALCKRPVMSTSFYPAIQRQNVTLVTDHIETITETGIRTVDGKDHDVDVIALGTGFHAHAYMRPMNIIGLEGVKIADVWADGLVDYKSLAVPGFPNMFMTYGPHSPLVHGSVQENVELLAGYVIEVVHTLAKLDATAMTPKQSATDEWLDRLHLRTGQSIFAACSSYYTDVDGKPAISTAPRKQWQKEIGKLALEDYVVT